MPPSAWPWQQLASMAGRGLQASGGAGMSSLKVLRRTALQNRETCRSEALDASSVRVIRDRRIGNAGVTAGTTVAGISDYSRRQ